MSTVASRWVLAAWVAFVLGCVFVVSRITITTDVSALLPRSPTPAQQVLVGQLREGVVSRLVLIGIEGAAPDALAELSGRVAADLRARDDFAFVENGDDAGAATDREFLWRNRYLLSAAVTPQRFSVGSMRARLAGGLSGAADPAARSDRRAVADPGAARGAGAAGDARRCLVRARRQAGA